MALGREVARCWARRTWARRWWCATATCSRWRPSRAPTRPSAGAAKLGGKGAVVVKRCKPGQDLRFDLPAAGPRTLEVMREVGARVLALEAGRTVLLDAPAAFQSGGITRHYGGHGVSWWACGTRRLAPRESHSLGFDVAVLPSPPRESPREGLFTLARHARGCRLP